MTMSFSSALIILGFAIVVLFALGGMNDEAKRVCGQTHSTDVCEFTLR